MKGDVSVNTIGIIIIVAATLTLFFIILPQVMGFLLRELALASPTVVSKELAGYVAISGAAPYSIKISYYPSSLPYNVKIKGRIVSVSMSEKAEGLLERTPATFSIPIDPEVSFEDVNSFFIQKVQDTYEVEAEWIEGD
ncbi:MAG: hypothetical protein ACE5J3_05130 [Methanosarcinales archaeon]